MTKEQRAIVEREISSDIKCEHCGNRYPIELPQTLLLKDGWYAKHNTGLNIVYCGHMNREYGWCPYCGKLESQFNAEARDQTRMATLSRLKADGII